MTTPDLLSLACCMSAGAFLSGIPTWLFLRSLSWRKMGGIYFLRIGRLRFSFCRVRQ
jgi:hypothetical protein